MSGLAHAVAFARSILFLGWTFFWLPVQAIALTFDMRLSWLIPRVYHRGNCVILGLREFYLICQPGNAFIEAV